ncbi:class I SAM-dependent methyltransferase [Flagellimonas sp. HMM57]|uniref:class I SAM-dependent methyltransferase n=1 Tax=unclassified Flagellimonas TaxID=2644544 RepID=UPI0013D7ACBD|nr:MULTISPECIES: class I SAM-dependent methyltransferase [unclassified Flagellimonas]UII75854.1 class I SAM-dependent methyltransferase [Flagellimonas sp. HMM57]
MSHFSIAIVFCLSLLSGLQAQYTESDWAERDEWMKTQVLLDMANVSVDDRVADIGCHEGYLSIHLSKLVQDYGEVYAVDVREDRLATLSANAKERKLTNIKTVLGEYDDPKLPKNSFDVVFIMDTYHEMESHEKILQHVKNALKKGGRLMILEKLKDRVKGKTRKEQVNAHSLSPGYVRKELKQAGFTIISEIENHGKWELEDDKQMWVILAQKL